MNVLPVVDWDALKSIRGLQDPSEPDIVAELVDEFLTDSAARMTRLREAARQGDMRAVVVEVHTLKGAAAQLAFREFHASAVSAEDELREFKNPTPGELTALVERLAVSHATVTHVLTTEREFRLRADAGD